MAFVISPFKMSHIWPQGCEMKLLNTVKFLANVPSFEGKANKVSRLVVKHSGMPYNSPSTKF